MKQQIATIKRASAIGLWGAVGTVIVAAAFVLGPYRFAPQSPYVTNWMLVAGTVLAVLAIAMAMMVVRRRIPLMRQCEQLEKKVEDYAQHVRSLYLSMLVVVVVVCVLMVLSSQSVLLMLAMVATMLLFLNYPNMYRVKVDLGLTDEEMSLLYGDKYIPTNEQ